MNLTFVKMMDPETRANILFTLDRYLRLTIDNEEIFMVWLEEGVPDGTMEPEELLDIEPEDFLEMWKLAEHLQELQANDEDLWI